jgi:hypothetical protein
MTKNIPNGHKIYQHLPSQDPPKYTQIGIYVGLENIPSGNPAHALEKNLTSIVA